jgi:exonuclease III
MFQSASDLDWFLAWPKQWKKDMRIGTWNVSSLYRVGAIKSVVGELETYKLDLVGVQDVRWEGTGYQTADNYTFFYGGMLITN